MNNFCVHCGNKLSGEKYCPSCGASVNETSHDEHTNNIKKQTNARKSSRNSLFVIVMIIINIISIIIFLKLGRYVYSTYYNSNKNNTSITDSVDKTNKSVSKSKSVTITGQWKDLNNRNGIYELEFFSDGTYKSNQSNYAGTYSADGNRLRLDGILMEDLVYTYELTNDTLTLYDEDGDPREYTKLSEHDSSKAPKPSKILGRWKDLNDRNGIDELEFFKDGTYKSDISNYAGTYSIDGNRLRLDGILMEDLIYTFQIDGDTLTLYDDKDKGRKYTKVN